MGPVRIYSFKDGLISEEDLMTALQYNYNNPNKIDKRLLSYLVADWQMDRNSTDMLWDSSKKGNHLKINDQIIRLRQKKKNEKDENSGIAWFTDEKELYRG